MELICPDCMGSLAIADGKSARCTTHGGEYQVLFSRWKPAPVPAVEPGPPLEFHLTPGSVCFQHQNVTATSVCSQCGAALCDVCAFDDSGVRFCPNCVTQRAQPAPPLLPDAPPALPAGVRCVQHPGVPAAFQCRACGAFMCATCDFLLPGGIHVCPACAAAPKTALSSKRKNLLIGSFVLSVWCTIVFAALMGGAFASFVETKAGEQVVGTLLMLVLLIPSLIGLALGLSAMDRRLTNPPIIWIATVWNGLICGGFVLLCIIGLMK